MTIPGSLYLGCKFRVCMKKMHDLIDKFGFYED
jgi:hypothetical protein